MWKRQASTTLNVTFPDDYCLIQGPARSGPRAAAKWRLVPGKTTWPVCRAFRLLAGGVSNAKPLKQLCPAARSARKSSGWAPIQMRGTGARHFKKVVTIFSQPLPSWGAPLALRRAPRPGRTDAHQPGAAGLATDLGGAPAPSTAPASTKQTLCPAATDRPIPTAMRHRHNLYPE